MGIFHRFIVLKRDQVKCACEFMCVPACLLFGDLFLYFSQFISVYSSQFISVLSMLVDGCLYQLMSEGGYDSLTMCFKSPPPKKNLDGKGLEQQIGASMSKLLYGWHCSFEFCQTLFLQVCSHSSLLLMGTCKSISRFQNISLLKHGSQRGNLQLFAIRNVSGRGREGKVSSSTSTLTT